MYMYHVCVCVCAGSNQEAVKFLQRHGDSGEQVIVRMRGLPYSCTTEQVVSQCACAVASL